MANPAMANPDAADPALAADHAEHATTTAVVEDHGADAHYPGPTALGVGATAWVSLAMLVFIGILIWKKVPALITGGLDAKIAEIRKQLDEAKALRAEAEALRAEYSAKIANAEADAQAMVEHARKEADQIVAKAEDDSALMIARRQKMAEDKIAAAERAAVDELRARAASAAALAARGLIAEKHDAAADSKLVNEAISGI